MWFHWSNNVTSKQRVQFELANILPGLCFNKLRPQYPRMCTMAYLSISVQERYDRLFNSYSGYSKSLEKAWYINSCCQVGYYVYKCLCDTSIYGLVRDIYSTGKSFGKFKANWKIKVSYCWSPSSSLDLTIEVYDSHATLSSLHAMYAVPNGTFPLLYTRCSFISLDISWSLLSWKTGPEFYHCYTAKIDTFPSGG